MSFLDTIKPDPAAWKAGLRAASAAGIAWGVSSLLALPQGYWAVLTAIIVMQASVGASLKAATDRLLGTLAGAVIGFAIASVTPSGTGGTMVALVLATGLLTVLASHNPIFRVAPVTAAMVLVAAPSHTQAWISASHRVTEISLGCLIGIAVAMFVLPARADAGLRIAGAHVLPLLARLISLELQGQAGKASDKELAEAIYGAYDRIDALAQEARQEQHSRLMHSSYDTDRLRRALLSLRTAAFFLRRLPSLALPAHLGEVLEAPTAAINEATRDYLLALSPALGRGAPPPPTDELEAAFARLHAAARHARLERLDLDTEQTEAVPGRTAAFVSAFIFSLEQVHAAIDELAQCVAEMSQAGK
ncbi:FUSC family protein [Devosia sp. ZB163]|uniref:FUSC family protein n=1 Tax=Devosia sp. ZB163 TaxID=3025938 RepID=UPI002361EBCA|nr:FUSC family protein [Devosia sp. ZB163]MDC9822882.1 FUSC family protein [Devosia sp. ZB163]